MGRPQLDIDEDQVFELAKLQCTLPEMGAVLGCDRKTLSNRFSHIIDKGREEGKKSLRRLQWEKAEGGNVVMLIWLGKQWLGQSDKMTQDVNQTLNVSQLLKEAEGIDIESSNSSN